jgi:hypothetical protein
MLVPPTYLLLFAATAGMHRQESPAQSPNMGSPAIALVAGLIVLTSAVVYPFWLDLPHLEPSILSFQKVCAGKVTPGNSAMVFLDQKTTHAAPLEDACPYIYATRLWGWGKTVTNTDQARPLFQKFSPCFPSLDYVIFFGMALPDWVPGSQFHLESSDEASRLFIFRDNSGSSTPSFGHETARK